VLPGWRELIIKYQDRIMTGTDPVWNAHEIYRWYEADEGWFHYSDFQNFHRKWMRVVPILWRPVVLANFMLKMQGKDKAPFYREVMTEVFLDPKALPKILRLPDENQTKRIALDVIGKMSIMLSGEQSAQSLNQEYQNIVPQQ